MFTPDFATFEKLPPRKNGGPWKDEAVFLITDTLMIFDHLRQTIKIVACAFTEGRTDLKVLYEEQVRKIDLLVNRIRTPLEKEPPVVEPSAPALQAQMTPACFQNLVRRAKEYIVSGDVIQVVLSQRFQGPVTADPRTSTGLCAVSTLLPIFSI